MLTSFVAYIQTPQEEKENETLPSQNDCLIRLLPPLPGGRGSVTQSCQTLCNSVDRSPPGSSVHGISQARIPEWIAVSSSRGSSRPRDGPRISVAPTGQAGPFPLSHQGSRDLPTQPFRKCSLPSPQLKRCSRRDSASRRGGSFVETPQARERRARLSSGYR